MTTSSGPLAAIGLLKADLSIATGLVSPDAIPAVVVAGPLFSRLAASSMGAR